MSNRARESYEAFISEALKYGLPVQFLKRVAQGYTFEETDNQKTDSANVYTNKIKLRGATIDLLQQFASGKVDVGNGLNGVFHESAHAFIDLMENTASYRDFVAKGEAYYKGAQLMDGSTTTDESRLFNEAVGEYVGNRIGAWWAAYSDVLHAISRNGKVSDEKIQKLLQSAIRDYDKQMSKRVFGYEERTHWFWDNENLWTTKPLSEEMKKFLDSNILENAFPDNFSEVTTFRQMLKKSKIDLPEIPVPDRTEPLDVPLKPAPTRHFLPPQDNQSSASSLIHQRLDQQQDQMARQRALLELQRKQLQIKQREQMEKMRKDREKMDQERQKQAQLRHKQSEQTEKERKEKDRKERIEREREQKEQRERAERARQERARRDRALREQQERHRLVMRSRPSNNRSTHSTWPSPKPHYPLLGARGFFGVDRVTQIPDGTHVEFGGGTELYRIK